MTTKIAATIALSTGLFALMSVLAPAALAQSGNAGASPPAVDTSVSRTAKVVGAGAVEMKSGDMRLWSFGECDRSFPRIDSVEHKDCVRVVGSDEAKDARAVHYCDVSHAKDPVEATRCKDAYFANKSEAEHEGFRANPSTPAVGVPVVYTPKRDKAAEIAALTRALTAQVPEAPASAAADPAPGSVPAMEEEPPPSTFSTGAVMLWLSLMLLLAAIVIRQRRKAAEIDSLLKKSSHRVRNPKTMMNVPRKQY